MAVGYAKLKLLESTAHINVASIPGLPMISLTIWDHGGGSEFKWRVCASEVELLCLELKRVAADAVAAQVETEK